MPITLNHSNIGVQYSSDKSYIIETVKSDLYRRNDININNIVTNNLQTAPVTPTTYADNSGNVYATEAYTYSGTANTADYTRVFTKNTTCDILVVGGGGGGSHNHGGGGGAGGLVFINSVILNSGTYTIKIGAGGEKGTTSTTNFGGLKGNDTKIILNGTDILKAEGGGGGGQGSATGSIGNGGSGGGGDGYRDNLTPVYNNGITGTGSIKDYNGATGVLYGNNGGTYYLATGGTYLNKAGAGGGGGGAGQIGSNATKCNVAGYGGNGISSATINGITYNFVDMFGTTYGTNDDNNNYTRYFGGGGGGSLWGDATAAQTGGAIDIGANAINGIGGKGGGGNGALASRSYGFDGSPNTGGGGGGGSYGATDSVVDGGKGGSGIVIIRYLVGNLNNLFPTNNYLTNEPVVVAPTFTETTRTFAHSGGAETQTTHTITVARDTICDILVVGGGGGGGLFGGGGGAGSILFANNLLLNAGSYTIKVGKGGTGASNDTANGTNGIDSSILINAIEYISKGGGGGGSRNNGGTGFAGRNGSNGGSGGGGSSSDTIETIGGSTTKNTYTYWETYGNAGGKGKFGSSPWVSGGGGGAGSAGSDWSNTKGGNGGSGKSFVSYFGTNVGHNGWFGGGGGGNMYWPGGTFYDYGYGNGGNGLSGGGGNGANETNVEISATGGLPNTGGGGGGGKWDGTATNGGNGGSGIVIIKFKSLAGPILEGITHKRLNFAYTPNYPFIQADNTNLKAWYKFDGNYMDSSPSGFNLTNSGAAIVDGLIVQSLSTDASDFLETSGINLNGKTYSISFWLKFNTTPSGTIPLFTQGITDSVGTRLAFLYVNENNLRFIHYGPGNDMDTTGYNISSMIGTSWHHYVVTYNNTNRGAEIWFDGIKLNTNVSTLANTFTGSGNFTIARWSSYGTFNGLIEDFRYYDKVLTSIEITQLYNIPTQNTYTLNFPVPTLADLNNNSNIILRGAYDIALSTSNAVIIPKADQYIPPPTTFINYAIERMYPPVRNFTAATTIVSGQTYGNGTYVVTFSSTTGSSVDPWTCFNTDATTGGHWAVGRYTAGVFNNTSFIVAGYLGDWVKIQLPVAIKLTRFNFVSRPTYQVRSPKDFKIYGSNDNITWVELVNKTDAVYNASNIYEQTTPEITNTYTYYALVVNKIFSTENVLNFDEWYIYGQEVSASSLSLRYHLLNPVIDPIGAQWTYSSNNTNVYHMGRVGIGTTNPEYQLDVRGAIYSSVGGYTQTGLTTWSITSDRRIKENITRASYDICLENVKNIELYNFNFKNNCVNTNDKHQLGFIAQEVQQVYPKAVEVGKMILNTNEAISDILTLNTTQIDYTLYGAVKNLIEKIEDIDNDLENIEKAVGEPAPNTDL